MPTKTVEEITKDLQTHIDNKLAELAPDIKKSCLEDVKTDIHDQIEALKKDLRNGREITPNGDSKPHGAFKNLGEFYQAAALMDSPSLRGKKTLSDAVVKAMGETTGSTGGFFIPIEFRPELLKLIIEDQVVRPRAKVVPMATDTLWWPKIRDVSHVSSIHGGVKGTWAAEASNLQTNATGEPTAAQIQLIAKKFADYATVSNELVMDSPIAIPPLLETLGREGVGFFEDYSALWGTGANSLLGCVQCAASIAVTRQTASHITYKDCVTMLSHVFPSSMKARRLAWVTSPSGFADIMQMSLPVGTGGSAVYITNIPGQSAADLPPMTLLGFPLIVSEKMKALGTAGDLMLADFSYYIIGDRMELTITASEHVAFATDQTAFRIIERLDGQPWLDTYLTANNGSDTLSAFTYLS